jgi:DNA-binding transcriptional regulator YdaS (Cro superfamily)
MDLKTYFLEEPRGARKEMADYLEITPTWMSLLIHKKVKPSPELAIRIEKATQKLVSRRELLPDIFVR